MSEDGLALAMAGQGKKNGGGPGVITPRNVSDFRRWLLGNVSHYRNHPALGGYYGCDDCCHTSIAIEHNYGNGCAHHPHFDDDQHSSSSGGSSSNGNGAAASGAGGASGRRPAPWVGRGSVTGCPGEYSALAEIRREIFAADPYHLVFGTVARCFGSVSLSRPSQIDK